MWNGAKTVKKDPKSLEKVPEVRSHAGGYWFESSSLRRKVPDLCKIRDFSFIRLKKHA